MAKVELRRDARSRGLRSDVRSRGLRSDAKHRAKAPDRRLVTDVRGHRYDIPDDRRLAPLIAIDFSPPAPCSR